MVVSLETISMKYILNCNLFSPSDGIRRRYKYQDFIDMTRSELVDYLGVRGLGSTGNKAMLVSRAFVAWESNVPVKLSQEALASKIKVEYLSMLKHNILDPLAPQNYFWSDDVTKWPWVTFFYSFSNKTNSMSTT